MSCRDCGACSCDYLKGQCRVCSEIQRARRTAEEDIVRWRLQVEEGWPYATGKNGNRLHRWNCQTLPTVEQSLELLEREIEAARRNGYAPGVFWQRLPQLHTVEELRKRPIRRRHCALCGPDPL
ncbi:hypothetical protein [Streptomyces sp. NPDC058451]|uniref:hypothetical protein n=1 Tax=Streptomyces sp. NPDC058451 TaxID=3346506 RepID=UPI0036518073